jgi:hypothetical protein
VVAQALQTLPIRDAFPLESRVCSAVVTLASPTGSSSFPLKASSRKRREDERALGLGDPKNSEREQGAPSLSSFQL